MYHKKEAAGATAYTYYINRELKDFLYLKIEEEELSDMVPVQPARKRLKVGTFKVDNDNRHTTRGERFMKKIMDLAIARMWKKSMSPCSLQMSYKVDSYV